MSPSAATVHTPAGLAPAIDDFVAVVAVATDGDSYPYADGVEQNVVVYRADGLRAAIAGDPAATVAVRREMVDVLDQGPGIMVIKGAFGLEIIDRATEAFERIIAAERQAGLGSGDHYAKPGANDRVWNALEKLAVEEPEVFVDYYANDMVALGSLAWLGPNYQVTSQVNVVNPGGEAQQPHRDYHLGFMTDAMADQYPAHCHRLSPVLTLQGAVAHCEMPVETGPTMYLPHSQKYLPGFLAWRRPEFKEYFAASRIQLPLAKGDVVYFNPALFHAAGSNHTADVRRMANLLQISSAFGRTMETVDTLRMTTAVYPALAKAKAAGMPAEGLDNVIATCADGYAFPTNLDKDPPIGGLTPASQQDIVRGALAEGCSLDELIGRLEAHRGRQQSV
ncbi:MAG: phytanoyl-CoA dioxygenase family protein [Acidimicrobiia bacterium]|nr:phytanoyl-CoA dioxygenase family protein [Acidimicrobiia bacterium]